MPDSRIAQIAGIAPLGYRCGLVCWDDEAQGQGGLSSWVTAGEGAFRSATSPVVKIPFAFTEAIPSWCAETPPGSSLAVYLRVASTADASWSPYFCFGTWSSDPSLRSSDNTEALPAGRVEVDTLKLSAPCAALQARILLKPAPGGAFPLLRSFAAAYSTAKPGPGDTATVGAAPAGPAPGGAAQGGPALGQAPPHRGRLIEGVPLCSQMGFPDGGKAWCSPVSLAMLLGYWRGGLWDKEERVREAVAGVYDPAYKGCGNWSFNAAYAGSLGFFARVVRFTSLAALEPWIAAGVPIVASLSWDGEKGRPLDGAPIPRSSGHLSLIVGFDEAGNPLMNEPAAPSDAEVRRAYKKDQFEARWLEASGGTAYIVYPRGYPVPSLAS